MKRIKMELKMLEMVKALHKSERGDTNFISILIILGIVILLATTFMTFKDQIIEKVSGIVEGFTIK